VEPEVGVVIADLARFVQQHLRAGESGYKFLHVIDVGMPADPGQENEIWVPSQPAGPVAFERRKPRADK
jgi:hypothetical protein